MIRGCIRLIIDGYYEDLDTGESKKILEKWRFLYDVYKTVYLLYKICICIKYT